MCKRWFVVPAITLLLVVSQVRPCSWDYPVWGKSKRSDTPLFRFVVNERYGAGYINREGKIIIQPQYLVFGNQGGDFFEGLANVTTESDGDYYIDSTGKRVARSDYLATGDFSDGRATSWFSSLKKLGYIDHSGRLVIPAKFDQGADFTEGLAAVKMDGRFGYIDREGTFVIPPRFALAKSFADGHALVIERGDCQMIGYGPCEYPLNPPEIIPDVPGLAHRSPLVSPHRCRYSVIDRSGTILFSTNYIDAKNFSEGYAPMGDGQSWGYVDYSGNVVIPLQFEEAEPFSEGLALVRLGGKYGYINKQGQFAITPRFLGGLDFSQGMAVVTDGSKSWFIDASGNTSIVGEFDSASSFVMGLAHVRIGRNYYTSKWSYIDKTGRTVFTYSDQSGKPH